LAAARYAYFPKRKGMENKRAAANRAQPQTEKEKEGNKKQNLQKTDAKLNIYFLWRSLCSWVLFVYFFLSYLAGSLFFSFLFLCPLLFEK